MQTTNRMAIAKALTEALKVISNDNGYITDLYGNVKDRLEFWDDIKEFPAVNVSLGSERREYQGGGFKDRFLAITLRLYVKDEDPQQSLEYLLQDVETVIDINGRLAYQGPAGEQEAVQDIIVLSIDTDQGALAPLGVGEILLQVRY